MKSQFLLEQLRLGKPCQKLEGQYATGNTKILPDIFDGSPGSGKYSHWAKYG